MTVHIDNNISGPDKLKALKVPTYEENRIVYVSLSDGGVRIVFGQGIPEIALPGEGPKWHVTYTTAHTWTFEMIQSIHELLGRHIVEVSKQIDAQKKGPSQ